MTRERHPCTGEIDLCTSCSPLPNRNINRNHFPALHFVHMLISACFACTYVRLSMSIRKALRHGVLSSI